MRNLWYLATSTDQVVAAKAFAAAGVLAAAGWRPDEATPAEALAAAVDAAGSRPLAWSYPAVGTIRANVSDRDLASAWDECWTRLSTEKAKVARLVVDTETVRRVTSFARSTASGIDNVCRRLLATTAEAYAPATPRRPGDIAAVSFAVFKEAEPHEWSWPLKLRVASETDEELTDRIKALGAVERHGFLQISPPDRTEQDIVLLADPTRATLRATRDEPCGIGVLGMSLRQTQWSRNLLVQSALSASPRAPVAFLSIGREFLTDWVNAFTYAVAHDKSLDEAVFDAYREIRPRLGSRESTHPPILLTPKTSTIDELLGEVRLTNRVKELADDLVTLDPDTAIELPTRVVSSLGISDEARTAGDYGRDLKEALARGSSAFDFGREDAGTAVRLIRNAVEQGPVEASAPAVPPSEKGPREAAAPVSVEDVAREAPRFTDIAIHRGRLFASDLSDETRVPTEELVLEEGPYTLEVAIRLNRIGIEADRVPARPVRPARRGREDLVVYVVAQPLSRGIKIKDRLATLVWPFDQDSDSAVFAMEAEDTGAEQSLNVRLYDQGLDLLDIVKVVVAVTPRGADTSKLARPARHLIWPDPKPRALEVPPLGTPPPLFSIEVMADAGGYAFEFTFRDSADDEVKILSSPRLTLNDVQQLIVGVRNFWTDLVFTGYGRNEPVTRTTFGEDLKKLAALGQDAWLRLFGSKAAPVAGSSEALGRLIAATKAASDARIQVVYDDSAYHFVFPWSILYPADAGTDPVDPRLFWGTRFQIEQVRSGPIKSGLEEEPVAIAFVLDSGFGNSESEVRMLREYEAAANGRLRVTDPIASDRALLASLGATPAAHLYYFFCHGYAPGPGTPVPRIALQSVKERIEKLDPCSPDRELWADFLRLMDRMSDEPWIYVGNAEVKETVLRKAVFFGGRRPIVFLNMCQSAELLPSMSTGLVRVFLDKNASAVVGTECPMSGVFAHEFAQVMFEKLLAGCTTGDALLQARRHFMSDARRNPLALAYTLYGRAGACLGRGPIVGAAGADRRAG